MAQLMLEKALLHVRNRGLDLLLLQTVQDHLFPVLEHHRLVQQTRVHLPPGLVSGGRGPREVGLQLVVGRVHNTFVLVCSAESFLVGLQQIRSRYERICFHPWRTAALQSEGFQLGRIDPLEVVDGGADILMSVMRGLDQLEALFERGLTDHNYYSATYTKIRCPRAAHPDGHCLVGSPPRLLQRQPRTSRTCCLQGSLPGLMALLGHNFFHSCLLLLIRKLRVKVLLGEREVLLYCPLVESVEGDQEGGETRVVQTRPSLCKTWFLGSEGLVLCGSVFVLHDCKVSVSSKSICKMK